MASFWAWDSDMMSSALRDWIIFTDTVRFHSTFRSEVDRAVPAALATP